MIEIINLDELYQQKREILKQSKNNNNSLNKIQKKIKKYENYIILKEL